MKKIFNLLKRDCEGSYIDSDLMNFKEFNR